MSLRLLSALAHELEVALGHTRIGVVVVYGSTWVTSDLADVSRFVIGQKGKVFGSIVAFGCSQCRSPHPGRTKSWIATAAMVILRVV